MNRLVSVMICVGVFALGTGARAQTATTGASGEVSNIFAGSGGVNVLAGVRLWGNQWDIPIFDTVALVDPSVPGGFVLQDTATTNLSSYKVAFIPVVGLRVGNVIVTASYLLPTHYDARTPHISNLSRSEWDVTIGYSMLPVTSDGSLLISVGYKGGKIEEQTNPSVGQPVDTSLRINGALVGISGSAPLTDNLRLYGNAGYAFARQKLSNPTPLTELNDSLNSRYSIGEIGLSYIFFRGAEGQAVRSATVSLGYRAQVYTVKSFTLQTRTPSLVVIGSQTRDIDSTTQGAILTLNASF